MDVDERVETIELDVVHEGWPGLHLALADLTAGATVTTDVKELHGPGGGWPRVWVTGPTAELQRVLDRGGYADGIETYRVS